VEEVAVVLLVLPQQLLVGVLEQLVIRFVTLVVLLIQVAEEAEDILQVVLLPAVLES
jgi:hypothetical protein